MSVARYYRWLSAFHDLSGRVGHDTGHDTFTVHRRLLDGEGRPSGDVLHRHLHRALVEAGLATQQAVRPNPPSVLPSGPSTDDDQRRDGARHDLIVLDAGCGLGGTVFFLQAQWGGTYVGITLSPAQCDRAQVEARRRRLSDVCRFTIHSYDDDLHDLLPTGADLIIAIESLAHSPDPPATIRHLARFLRPGGLLTVVDDMPAPSLGDDDPDLVGFKRGWLCPAIATAAVVRRSASSAGLDLVCDRELTALVARRPPRALARRLRTMRVLSAALGATPARILLDSWHGGLLLERLYERGLMEYRLIMVRRPDEAL